MRNIESPHDINSYASFVLGDGSIEAMNSLLLAEENSNRNISNQVPQHVTENCYVIVNMSLLKSRLDKTVDSWSWILSKTYAVSSHTTNGPFSKGNNASHYRVAKRVYKCKTTEDLKKLIITRCVPGKNATERYTNIFNESEPHAVITYYFGEGERLIPASETSCVYPSVWDEIKRNLEKGIAPKRATHNALKKLGGINAVPSASHVPTISQVYEISRSLKSKNTNPLTKLIVKQVTAAQNIQLFKKSKQTSFRVTFC